MSLTDMMQNPRDNLAKAMRLLEEEGTPLAHHVLTCLERVDDVLGDPRTTVVLRAATSALAALGREYHATFSALFELSETKNGLGISAAEISAFMRFNGQASEIGLKLNYLEGGTTKSPFKNVPLVESSRLSPAKVYRVTEFGRLVWVNFQNLQQGGIGE